MEDCNCSLLFIIYINFNDNGRPGTHMSRVQINTYLYKYTLVKVKVYVFS